MKFLKKYPLFLVGLPVFFCLHGWLENYGFIETGEMLLLCGGILFFVLLLFGLLYLLTKRNTATAGLLTLFIGLWYLFFGAIVDALRNAHWYFLSSYSFLLPACVIATVILLIVLLKKQNFRAKLFYFCNILLLIYCVVDGVRLFSEATFSELPQKNLTRVPFDGTKVPAKPNVYFMLFDEYAGYKSLLDSFHFRNDTLNNYLTGKGFKMMPYYANYDFTIFSMSSVLNMRYVPEDYHPLEIEQKDLQRRITEIRNARVFDIFKEMGYRVSNFSIFDIGDQHGISAKNELVPVHSMLITDKILHNRIMRTSGFLFTTGKWAIPSLRKKYLFETDRNNLNSEMLLLESAANPDKQPRFSYTHFLMPHWPFYRDSLGRYVDDAVIINEKNMENKPLYISYVKYTNREIQKIVNTIMEKDPGAIILIMSDHGFRSYDDRFAQPYVFDNFAALRLPSGQYPGADTGRSNVNIFRYLLNTAFGQKIPYAADSSIVLKYSK